MHRITHIAKSRQRYERVPALWPDGSPRMILAKETPDGERIYRAATYPDKSRPLPDEVCESCGLPILVGTAYKWFQPGFQDADRKSRHEGCPDWHPWELSDEIEALWLHAIYLAKEGIAVSNDLQEVFDILQAYGLHLFRLGYNQLVSARLLNANNSIKKARQDRILSVAAMLEAKSIEILDFVREFDVEEQPCGACFGKGTRYSMRGPVTCIVCGGAALVPFSFETWRDSLAGSELMGIPS